MAGLLLSIINYIPPQPVVGIGHVFLLQSAFLLQHVFLQQVDLADFFDFPFLPPFPAWAEKPAITAIIRRPNPNFFIICYLII